jgi:murein L,D-transpeptidase YafK
MIKKISLAAILLGFSVLTIFAVNQFFVMPWNSSDLPAMENSRIVIKKKARTLEVFDGEKLIKTYTVALGFAPEGDKEIEGDGKTPEGDFYIFTKNPESKFYLSLGVSYPSTADAERGLREELITPAEHDAIVKAVEEKKIPLQNTKLGGEIYIHGSGNAADWTAGCVAMTNSDMKELYESIPVLTPVRIEP